MANNKGFLKSVVSLVSDLFGINKFSKSEEGQAIQDSINDVGHTLGVKGNIFQTKKVKEEAEKRAVEAEREAQQQIAKNTGDISKSLEELVNILGGGKSSS